MSTACRLWLGLLAILATAAGSAAETMTAGNCSVSLLSGDDRDQVPSKYRDVIVTVTDRHREIVRNALPLMPELPCLATQKVVFVEDPRYAKENGWVLADWPTLVFINYISTRAKASQTLLHEATHVADGLLNSVADAGGLLDSWRGEDLYPKGEADADDFPEAALARARAIVKANRLDGGIRAEWVRLHRNFQSFSLAGDYRTLDENGDLPKLGDPAAMGFMSNYGATAVGEDVAEFASWMNAAPLFTAGQEGFNNAACRAMQDHGEESVPVKLSALFTMANFMLTTGLATQTAYKACVGHLKMRGHDQGASARGFFTYKSGRLDRSYQESPKAGFEPKEERFPYEFQFNARGTAATNKEASVPVMVVLRLGVGNKDDDLDKLSLPRGLFNVGLKNTNNQFYIQRTDDQKVLMEVTEGVALVSRASTDLIEGTLVVQKFLNYAGGAMSAIAGPEPPSEPTQIAFRFSR